VKSGRAHVVAIIVIRNSRRWVPECLRTLLGSHLEPDVLLDVIVIDNASNDGGAELVAALFPGVELIRSPSNRGFAGGCNLGMAEALRRNADHVLLINPDTRTPPDLVQGIVTFLRQWPEYGVVGPMQYTYMPDDSPSHQLNQWSCDALAAGEAHIFVNDGVDRPSPAGPLGGRAPNTLEHAYVQGSAFACRSAVLRDVGLLDVTYHSYYEESDLCRRARWAGWRVALLLALKVQHYGGGDTRYSSYRRRHMLRNKYYFLATDPDWDLPAAAALAARWLVRDLSRRGACAAPRLPEAVLDTLVGLAWLVVHTPQIVIRRRVHSQLRRATTSRRPSSVEVRR